MATEVSRQYYPKHQIIRDELLKMIRRGEYAPGDTLPSQRDLASEYQVSLTTVRQSLGELTRAGVVRAEAGRGIFVEEVGGALVPHRGGQNGQIGFACWVRPHQDQPYMMMVNGATERAQASGRAIRYMCVDPNDSSGVDTCLDLASDLEAMIVCGKVNLDHLQPERLGSTKVVILGDLPDDSDCKPFNWVTANGHAAGHLAVQMLLVAGHRDVALVTIEKKTDYFRKVEEGFRSACRGANLPEPKIIIREAPDRDAGGGIARAIVADNSVTGVVVIDDALAARLVVELREAGRRTPQDISVVGVGGLPRNTLAVPGLSRIDIGYQQMGAHAVDLLLNGNSLVHEFLTVYVDSGDTVAPPAL